MNLNNLIRENIKNLKPYSSARDEYNGETLVKLDANENPFGEGINRYPDPYQIELKKGIAAWKGMNEKNLILGNGSDELIDLIIRAFCEPGVDEILTFKPTYGMYKVSADINNVPYNEIPLSEEFILDPEKLLKAVKVNTKLIFLCSPNNPSGNTIKKETIEFVLGQFNGIVVIDEAYIDFSEEMSWISSLDKYPQLFVIQTFSKAIGMAGIRLGMGWGSYELIQILNKIKPPYNVNELTQIKALEKLRNVQLITEQINEIKQEKSRLLQAFETFSFVNKIYPSEANFILIKVKDSGKLYNYLLQKGIVIRDRSTQYGCENTVRISVGNNTENNLLIKALNEFEK